MQTFLVLGLIPGTNIQINFFVWLVIGVIVLGYLANGYLSYLKFVRKYVREIERPGPKPASSFHTRLK